MRIIDCVPALCFIVLLHIPAFTYDHSCVASADTEAPFKVGLEVLRDLGFAPLQGKKVGLIVNHSAQTREGDHALDMLYKAGIVVRLFAPEHGIRGTKDELINSNDIDSATGLPVISLYTVKKKGPSAEDLRGLDALVFDIQEIGVRYYTYATTLIYCMKAAAEAGIPIYVLDRPNMAAPLGVYGPILEKEFHGGFTSYYPIPIAHGMTIGELARFYNEEFGIKAKLRVVPMQGYDRTKFYDELGFPWRNPSPNIREMNAVIGYHCLGMLEDMTWSVGRGTQAPFLTYGVALPNTAMQVGFNFVKALQSYRLSGVDVNFVMFNPISSKLQGQTCMGFQLVITDRRSINPMRVMLAVFREVVKLFPDSIRNKEIDRTARSVGSRKLLAMVKAGKSIDEIERTFRKEAQEFEERSRRYHLYSPATIGRVIQSLSFEDAEASANTKSIEYTVLPPYEQVHVRVKKVIEEAIADQAFPGASVGIWYRGRVIMRESFGTMSYAQDSPKTPHDAIYDMASLTKVFATTMCIMKLYDEGRINLEDSVVQYIPEFAAHGKAHIRIKNLLLHNSGLAAFRPYDLRVKGAEEAMKALYTEKLVYPTGDSTVYSDLGFILLGEIIRRITGKALDVYFAEVIARPLGLASTVFNPDSVLRRRVMPTEHDTTWKQDFARPLVHDPRAALLHGVAGHAGLFSSLDDVLRMMQVLIEPEKVVVQGKPLIMPQTVRLFTTRANAKSSRALGWDTKAHEQCSCGNLFSPLSFGHTGFTGTSVWYDPERKLGVVFLSNRVHPSSQNIKIRAVRPLLHDTIVKALEQ
ncbi:MAG: DUF1343 domain-containing protein [Bacteroidota bacterium]|nr:DUF1343 domain-containing protein [Candidatus Kapabacteria bacterium]MDW8219301.1 DUF1343 domain-containing protein [Bacteroidota bacterium]